MQFHCLQNVTVVSNYTMDTEIGLVPLFQSTIQKCVRVSCLNMQMHAGISVSFPVLITSVKKHCVNSAGMYMWLSQLTHCLGISTVLPPSRIHLSLLSFIRAGSM